MTWPHLAFAPDLRSISGYRIVITREAEGYRAHCAAFAIATLADSADECMALMRVWVQHHLDGCKARREQPPRQDAT